MKLLENLYEIRHKNNHFFNRKISIKSKRTLIRGVKKAGKTSLIIDYLSKFNQENILYIDLNDTRVNSLEVAKNLKDFISSKLIKILVIENFDNSFELPCVNEIIISSDISFEGYDELTLYPLDFEEFISFDSKFSNIEHIFNNYTNKGSYPQTLLNNSNSIYWSTQEMIKLMIKDQKEFEIFKTLCIHQSSKVSLYRVYNYLKNYIKISKDKLYKVVKKLEDEKMIFLVPKYNSPNSLKKLYLIDFAMRDSLTFKKDFIKKFENMVFLELIKRGKRVYYTDYVELYIEEDKKAIFCIPFLPQEMIRLKLQKIINYLKEINIQKVDVITVGNQGEFWLKNIKCSITPFWEWALAD